MRKHRREQVVENRKSYAKHRSFCSLFTRPNNCSVGRAVHCSLPRARGFALVEALVAASILSGVLAFSVGAYLLAAQNAGQNGAGLAATYLANEGVEAVRLLRDSGWSAHIASLTAGSTYYVAWDGSNWTATTTNTYIDGTFERSVILSNVYRDGNADIASSGTLDPNTKQVTVTVSWLQNAATSSRSLTAYITNLFNN